MSLTCFSGQWDHQESLLGGRQGVPFVWLVLEHDFVVLIVYDHSMTSLVVDAEQGAGLIASPVNQVHVDGLAL